MQLAAMIDQELGCVLSILRGVRTNNHLRRGNRFMRHHHPASRPLRGILVLAGSLLSLITLLSLLTFAVSAASAGAEAPRGAQPTPTASPSACALVRAVPALECEALVELYTKTGGSQWLSQTNWLALDQLNAPCDWFGVTCADGHISELLLARNGLSGTLPLTLGDLSRLTRLRLEQNALVGRNPPTLCGLAGTLHDSSLAYNGLFTKRRSVETCLQKIEPDWQATQTAPVTDLHLAEIFTNALRLAWTPIPYTADGGYYEIAVSSVYSGPYTLHGQTADKSVDTYLVDGLEPGRTYYVQVRSYTPPHDQQIFGVRSRDTWGVGVTRATAGRVLVAAYFPADNDLANDIPYVLERFRLGTALNPNVQVLLLVDGGKDGDTVVLSMANGQMKPTNAVAEQWHAAELDTADPQVLTWFLQYARRQVPAERTVVSLLGHGIAVAPEVAWPAPRVVAPRQLGPAGTIPPLPKEHDFTPSDITNRGYMSAIDVGQALLAATDNGANPFDIVFFDQCFQGSLDSLYEVHKTARVFIASPNYAWLAASYQKYLTQLLPTATPEEMAQAIIELYQGTLDRHHPNAIFWMRGKEIPLLAEAVSRLGDALRAVTAAGEESTFVPALQQSKYVDTTQCGRGNLELGPPDELIGLDTFVENLQQTFVNDRYGVAAALDEITIFLDRIEKRTRTGNPYLAPDEFWDYRDTITILAPLPRTALPGIAWRASIYRSDAPFTATWSLDPTQTVTVTASLAYAREGRWDDFLAVWYQNLTPTVGQWCHYIPREQVILDEADVLTLTANPIGTAGLQLNWTPTDDKTATEYWLYRIDPYDINWTLAATLATDQTVLVLKALAPGNYRFVLVARNAANEAVSQSNEIVVFLGNDLALPQLFLPLIRR
jgi:hypothetical protein